jgi:hypothetical protein
MWAFFSFSDPCGMLPIEKLLGRVHQSYGLIYSLSHITEGRKGLDQFHEEGKTAQQSQMDLQLVELL